MIMDMEKVSVRMFCVNFNIDKKLLFQEVSNE